MSEIVLAPIDIVAMWVNGIRFSIRGPIDGECTQDVSLNLGLAEVDPDDSGREAYQLDLSVKCEMTPAESGEKAAEAEVVVSCVVAPEGVDEGVRLGNEEKRVLLANGVSFAYGEARSRIASLFEGSLARTRVDIRPVFPKMVLDAFFPDESSDEGIVSSEFE